jgi:hypothetical protein
MELEVPISLQVDLGLDHYLRQYQDAAVRITIPALVISTAIPVE